MKALVLCLALAVLPAFGEQRSVSPAPIVIYMQFHDDPPAAVLDALEQEVETIMDPMDLRFEWRSLTAAGSSEVSVELAVVTFKGRCDTSGLLLRNGNPGPLGWTHVSNGSILPFTDVDCDGIRGFVGKQLVSLPAAGRDEAYGRALGRVLAHELYHIFANTVRHGSDGVAKPTYTVQDLLAADFHFEAREALSLKANKPHGAAEAAPPFLQ